jgi:riboflavin synthase
MFTGIIQALGKIESRLDSEHGSVYVFKCTEIDLSDTGIGDSVAVNGVCLTVIEVGDDFFKADVSLETLNCTILRDMDVGYQVNLEKALRINQGIDGHLVSGHVDGVAEVVSVLKQGESTGFKIKSPKSLVKYIARKGSVCINGVSLTVNSIESDIFDINIVPHTLSATNLKHLALTDKVNIEVDIIARHLEQLLNN